jgi:hypothetical protein
MAKPHFTFWIAAGVGLIWNLMGCLNYIVQTNPDSVAKMPELYQLMITDRPGWATAAFAIGVFGGAVGCILLLLRRSVAVAVLVLSVIGIVGTAIYTTLLVGFVPSTTMALLVGVALLWYATIARRANWLR